MPDAASSEPVDGQTDLLSVVQVVDLCSALTDDERRRVLAWLCGYVPHSVQQALEEVRAEG